MEETERAEEQTRAEQWSRSIKKKRVEQKGNVEKEAGRGAEQSRKVELKSRLWERSGIIFRCTVRLHWSSPPVQLANGQNLYPSIQLSCSAPLCSPTGGNEAEQKS
jgi:hypothetical protein